MEQQNEQLPENAVETIENGAEETAAEETATTVAEIPADENKEAPDENKESAVVTNSQATIKIEGQEFELEAALAQDDKLLKTVLQPHFASIENANITRDVKEGKLSVSIVKRAQHKGA